MNAEMKAAMPAYWQHYFNPDLPWQDSIGEPIKITKDSGITPPKLLSGPDPIFNDFAKEHLMKTASVVSVIGLVVDANGNPQRIFVVRPVGVGLDEDAVAAVSHYRFAPAAQNGAPVPVRINIEVNFHSY